MNGEKDVKWNDVNIHSSFQESMKHYTYVEATGTDKKEVGVDIGCVLFLMVGGILLLGFVLYFGSKVIQWLFA